MDAEASNGFPCRFPFPWDDPSLRDLGDFNATPESLPVHRGDYLSAVHKRIAGPSAGGAGVSAVGAGQAARLTAAMSRLNWSHLPWPKNPHSRPVRFQRPEDKSVPLYRVVQVVEARWPSNQTQAQQIGIQQPLDRRPLRFESLECRDEHSCIVLSSVSGAPRRQRAASNVSCHCLRH